MGMMKKTMASRQIGNTLAVQCCRKVARCECPKLTKRPARKQKCSSIGQRAMDLGSGQRFCETHGDVDVWCFVRTSSSVSPSPPYKLKARLPGRRIVTRLPNRIVPPIRVLSPSGINTTTCAAMKLIPEVFKKAQQVSPK